MQFRKTGSNKWLWLSGSKSLSQITKEGKSLLGYIVEVIDENMKYGEKIWLVFSVKDEKMINASAAIFLPFTGDRSAIFLDCVMSKFKEMRKERVVVTYVVATDPGISVVDAKPHKLRLAIQFEKY